MNGKGRILPALLRRLMLKVSLRASFLSGSWCTPYECCFYYSNSCYDSNADECNEHEICSTVFDRLRKKSASTNTQVSSSDPSPQLADNELMILARACDEEQLNSDDSECRMLCKVSSNRQIAIFDVRN